MFTGAQEFNWEKWKVEDNTFFFFFKRWMKFVPTMFVASSHPKVRVWPGGDNAATALCFEARVRPTCLRRVWGRGLTAGAQI